MSISERLPFKLEHIITADGSSSLALSGHNEQYHSVHGAVQESKIVYLNNGFNYFNKQDITILEIGFGTGLNCLLTFIENEKLIDPKNIHYTALEPYPIAPEIIQQLNYSQLFSNVKTAQFYHQIHQTLNDELITINTHFEFIKKNTPIQEYEGIYQQFDLVYFDAFGPAIQPEMWTKTIFEKIFAITKQGGILVTYCAKGEVKRNLKAAGFSVEGLPGPPGKREVTRAFKQ